MKKGVIWILSLYLAAVASPGLLGVQVNSTPFILYQVICFSILLLYTVIVLIRQWPNVSLYATEARFALIYIGFLVATGLNIAILAAHDGESIASLAQFFLPAILAIVLIFGFGKLHFDRQDAEKLLQVITAMMVFSSLYNIILNFQDITTITSIAGSYDVDIKGFFYNRNVLGYMMATGIASALYLWVRQKKWIYAPTIAILVVSLLATMSRGAIIFTLIFCIIFLLNQYKSKLAGAAVLAAILVPLSLFAINQPFIQNNYIRSDSIDTGRTGLREFGLDYFMQHNILLGDGQRAMTALEEEYDRSSYHNLYIESLVTQGILGVAIVLLGIGYAFSRIRIVIRKYPDLGFFFLAYLLAYVAYIFIEALPLFYATPNSIVTTYIILLMPLLLANFINKQADLKEYSGSYSKINTGNSSTQ